MKALLTLYGGRSLPLALVVIHERPDAIVVVSSEQSHRSISQLKQALEEIQLDIGNKSVFCSLDAIDMFDLEKTKDACENAIKLYPKAEWIFHITGAPVPACIMAYEVARKYQEHGETPIRCWYLNTSQTRVISLIGEGCDENIFNIRVEDYMKAYYYRLENGGLKAHYERFTENDWLSFARMLGNSSHRPRLLKQIMSELGGPPPQGEGDTATRPYKVKKCTSDDAFNLLKEAQDVGLVKNLHREETSNFIKLHLSERQYRFLDGVWLEVYALDAAKQLKIFDDCVWDQEIKSADGKTKMSHKEMDVSMTYKAQLIIAECKTGKEAKETKTLDALSTAASLIGDNFVTKILVTDLSPSDNVDKNKEDSFERLNEKARERKIVVVKREDLPNISKILEREAKNPTYPRR